MVISIVGSCGYMIFDRGICNQRVGGSNPSVGSIFATLLGLFPEYRRFPALNASRPHRRWKKEIDWSTFSETGPFLL